MKPEYDFSKMKARRNPYAAKLKQPITIRLDISSVAYFKSLAAAMNMPYQHLINLFLRDCAENRLRPKIQWTRSR